MTLVQKSTCLFFVTAAFSSYVGDPSPGSDTLDSLCLLQQHFRVVPNTPVGDFGFGALLEEEEEQAVQGLRDDPPDSLGDEQSAMQRNIQKILRSQRNDIGNSHKLKSWHRTPSRSRTQAQQTIQHGFSALPEEPRRISSRADSANSRKQLEMISTEQIAQPPRDDQPDSLGDQQSATQRNIQKRLRAQRMDFGNSHKLKSWHRTPSRSRTQAQRTIHDSFSGLAKKPMRISPKADSANIRKQLETMSADAKLNLQWLKEHRSSFSGAVLAHAGLTDAVQASPANSLVDKSQVAAGLVAQTPARALTRHPSAQRRFIAQSFADSFTKVVGDNNTNSSIASEPIEYEFYGARFSRTQRDLYAMFAAEAALVIFICLCGCVGLVAENDGSDDSTLDRMISKHPCCWMCIDVAYCCGGILGDWQMVCCSLLMVIIINVMWWVICLMGLVEQYATQILLYVFVGVISVFLLVLIIKCGAYRIMNGPCGQEFQSMRAKISMMSHCLEIQHGKKYIHMMSGAKDHLGRDLFTSDQIGRAKGRMKKSGSYVRDKVDDVTDFLGITEISDEDEVTAKDLFRGCGDCMREGPVDKEEFRKRNYEGRTEAEKKVMRAKHQSEEAAAQAALVSSRGGCL